VAAARELAGPLTAMSPGAYAASKQRIRSRALAWASPLVPAEMVGFPAR
jgi:hypothetical protein